jgi:hypothetical protein
VRITLYFADKQMSSPSLELNHPKTSRLRSSSSASNISDSEKSLPRIILKNKTAAINIPRAAREITDASPRSIDLQSAINNEV